MADRWPVDPVPRAPSNALPRDRQDAFAAESHRRADAAQQAGLLEGDITPVTVPQRRGDALIVAHDEGVRGETTIESLAGLRPEFDKNGNITAGNASQISDGASALVVTTLEVAEQLGIAPLAEILAFGQVAGPDASLLHQSSKAIKAAAERAPDHHPVAGRPSPVPHALHPHLTSWINQVKRLFAHPTSDQLQRSDHRSVQALEADLPGAKPATTTRSRSCGPRPPTRSCNPSPDYFNELQAQDASRPRR